jgi:hypothetical protein
MNSHNQHIGIVHQQRFHDLGFAEQFVLWSVRTWLRAYCRNSKLFGCVHEAFDRLGIPDARTSFDNGMAVIAVGTYRELLFLGVESQYVSRNERDFLSVIAALQSDQPEEAYLKLDAWLPISGTRIAGAAFAEFAQLLDAGGLLVKSIGRTEPNVQKPLSLLANSARLH